MKTIKKRGPRTSPESLEARRLVLEEGYTLYGAAIKMGLHRNALYGWHKKLKLSEKVS